MRVGYKRNHINRKYLMQKENTYTGLFVSTVARVILPQAIMATGLGYLISEERNTRETLKNTGMFSIAIAALDVAMLPPALAILRHAKK
jgi:hypothetical protein